MRIKIRKGLLNLLSFSQFRSPVKFESLHESEIKFPLPMVRVLHYFRNKQVLAMDDNGIYMGKCKYSRRENKFYIKDFIFGKTVYLEPEKVRSIQLG